MALESDIQNANSRLVVFFHKKAKKNNFRSEQEGRPIFDDVIYIKKMVPGDSLSIIDRPMYESDKKDRKSTRLNSSHSQQSRMPSSA